MAECDPTDGTWSIAINNGETSAEIVQVCGDSVGFSARSALRFIGFMAVACAFPYANWGDEPNTDEERVITRDPVEGAESRAAPASRPIDLCGLARGPPVGSPNAPLGPRAARIFVVSKKYTPLPNPRRGPHAITEPSPPNSRRRADSRMRTADAARGTDTSARDAEAATQAEGAKDAHLR